MAFTPFPPRQPTASARLPLTLMTLDDWALATITGADSEKYMQGQVTADVSQMTEDQHLLAAHCDAKGKMWSNLRLFRDGDGFAWISPDAQGDMRVVCEARDNDSARRLCDAYMKRLREILSEPGGVM